MWICCSCWNRPRRSIANVSRSCTPFCAAYGSGPAGRSWLRLAPELNVLIFSRAEAERNRHLYLDMIEDALLLVDRGGFFSTAFADASKAAGGVWAPQECAATGPGIGI